MSPRSQHLRPITLVIRVGVYIFFCIVAEILSGPVFGWLGGFLLGITLATLLSAIVANQLSLGIFEALHLPDAGLRWNPAAARNLGLGLGGGVGGAVLVLAPPLLAGAAHFAPVHNPESGAATLIFTAFVLLCGASGEELLVHGYGFQILLRSMGPFATILPVGVIFAALHSYNPSSTALGLVNTAGFGVLFGYGFLRSYDLWLPIGLHFGWNLTLPLFGVNVSGLKIGVTGHTLEWTAGALWSGGDYGPEGSILTSVILIVLFVYVWKAPVHRQVSALLDPPAGDLECAPSSE